MAFRQRRAERASWSTLTVNGSAEMGDDSRTLRYSTNRFKNATKCSAFLMFPGMASLRRSSGRTFLGILAEHRAKFFLYKPGLVMNASSSEVSAVDSCRPSTSFAYSSCSLAASVFLILKANIFVNRHENDIENTHSSIFSLNFTTLREAESSIGLVRSMLKDSMHTLSARNCSKVKYLYKRSYQYCGLHRRPRLHLLRVLLKLVLQLWGQADSETSR